MPRLVTGQLTKISRRPIGSYHQRIYHVPYCVIAIVRDRTPCDPEGTTSVYRILQLGSPITTGSPPNSLLSISRATRSCVVSHRARHRIPFTIKHDPGRPRRPKRLTSGRPSWRFGLRRAAGKQAHAKAAERRVSGAFRRCVRW
jgi:hypothetical protein